MARGGVYLAPYAGVLAIAHVFILWWPFIDGHYLIQGVDLRELLWTHNADRCFDIIDSIIINDALIGADVEGGMEKIRTAVLSVYNEAEKQDGNSNDTAGSPPPGLGPRRTGPIQFTEQAEQGYLGLEPAFGVDDDGEAPWEPL